MRPTPPPVLRGTRPPTARSRLRRTALLVTAALVLLSGCGGAAQDSVERVRARATALVDEVRSAVEEAKERSAAQTGDVERRAPAGGRQIRTDTGQPFDYEQYRTTLEQTIALLEQYWSSALPQRFGVAYSSPSRYVYYRPEEGPGPACAGEPAPPQNAFYCPPGDFIAWDETGLMIPYYVGAGDFAAAFVLAHEFGHAMQQRLPQQERIGVLRELQADCFAGAWARYVQDQRLLEAGDLDEATFAVFSGRDLPGTPYSDPAAHGSGFERTRAFSDGFKGDPKACSPAPRADWLITSAGR